MSSTIDYYNTHAREFVDSTKDVAFADTQERFVALLPAGAAILDFGCGSGRDARYFLERGYRVEAVDGSEEMCRIASAYAGIPVWQMYFQELDAEAAYDGIWACSSILHLDKDGLHDVLARIAAALRPGGICYTSFKYGTFSGVRKGRYFTDLTESTAEELVDQVDALTIEEQWITGDVRPGRSDEKWLNLILRREE